MKLRRFISTLLLGVAFALAPVFTSTADVLITPFAPTGASTVNIAVGAASTNVQVTAATSLGANLRLVNSGSQVVFVEFGTTNAIAATVAASMPILPNTVEVFNFGGPVVFVAAIASAAGSTLYITVGSGS
jgi:hypothetical protein